MVIAVSFESDAAEPLALVLRDAQGAASLTGVAVQRFEFTSRGDRVPGRLLLPADAAAAHPLVLLQHGATDSKDADYLDATAGPWVRNGAAVACIDLPLHGERASAKLGELALRGLFSPKTAGDSLVSLAIDFAKQAVVDLRRCIDVLDGHPRVDTGRVVYAGFSLGAMLGAVFCAEDPRPRAAALALGGGGLGPAEVDPVGFVGRIAPRPVLFVGALEDATIPRSATDALIAAARGPHEVAWFEGGHKDLPGAALKCMWSFLRAHLDL